MWKFFTRSNQLIKSFHSQLFKKLSFFLSDLNNNVLKYMIPLLLQPICSQLRLWTPYRPSLYIPSQISALSKSCYYHIRELRCMCPYLDFKAASTIATSIVHSTFDFTVTMYHNLPNYRLNRLPQIQNSKVGHMPPGQVRPRSPAPCQTPPVTNPPRSSAPPPHTIHNIINVNCRMWSPISILVSCT